MLNSAATLESSAFVEESSPVDGKGAVRAIILDDWGRGPAEGAVKGLDVVASGKDAGEAGEHGEGKSELHIDYVNES